MLHYFNCGTDILYFFDQTQVYCFLFVLSLCAWLLFDGGIYFIGKLANINDESRATELFKTVSEHSTFQLSILRQLIDTGSSTCMQPLNPAVNMEMGCRTQIALAQSWLSLLDILATAKSRRLE